MNLADILKAAPARSAVILTAILLGLQTTSAQNLIAQGDALSNRNFNSDNGPTNSQLTLDFPVTQAGILQNILTWGENSGGGGLNGVGQSFELFVLRPVSASNYQVVFATGYLTVTNLGTNTFTVSGTPFGLQAGDVVAHYGRGIPFNNNSGGPSSVYIATTVPAPVLGTTISVPSATYPLYNDGGRNYAIQVLSLGQPFVVTTNGDNGPGSLRQAVLNAAASTGLSTINFATNLSGSIITLTNGQIELTSHVTIDASALTNGIQINGNAQSRVFQVDGGVTAVLNDLVITNGTDFVGGDQGGGVLTSGFLTLNNCTLAGNLANSSDGGGGICSQDGLLTVNNCTFTGNQAGNSFFGGAGICVGGDGSGGIVNVNNCTFTGNQAEFGGAIAVVSGTVNVNNCTLSGNQAGFGGGIDIFGGVLNVTNTIVCSNLPNNIDAPVNSGANNLTDANALLAALGYYGGPTQSMPPLAGSPAIDAGFDGITNSLATDQRGRPRLAGAHVDIGAVEVNPNTIVTNPADGGPGSLRTIIAGLHAPDVVSFAPNLSGQTLFLSGVINLNQSLAVDASALANGLILNGNGADRIFIIASGATNSFTGLTLTGGSISGGFSPVTGGALQNFGALTAKQCSFTGNTGSTGNGGAIYNDGTLTLIACTLSSNSVTANANQAGGIGGALYNDGTATLVQCTLAGNFGGAIFNEGVLALVQCTVSGNVVGNNVAGVFTGTGAMATLINTILAGTTGNSSVDFYADNSTNYFLGTNLIQSSDGNGGVTTGNPPLSVNPQLAPLGNYGGPTLTLPPLFGSPVINGGSDANAASLPADQRGQPRISGAHVDIGAVEFQSGLVVSSLSDAGENSLRADTAYNSSGVTLTFAANLGGQTILLTNGQITLSNNVTIDGSALASGIQINGHGISRVFQVNAGISAVLNSLIITNGTASTGNAGGGVLNNGTLTVNNCALLGNTSTLTSGAGGGAIHNSGTLIVNNSTLVGNHSAFVGGAIANAGAMTAQIINCTIAGNSAASSTSGGIFNNGGTVDLTNSIVDGNTTADIANAGTLNQANNVVGIGNPRLATLGNYGGPTPTMPPLHGSVAIDAGNDAAAGFLTTDQRGYPRFSGAHVDIGAVEAQVASTPYSLAGVTRSGNGFIQFGLTNRVGGSFTVFSTTNLTLPFNTWSNLGPIVESPTGSGQFQFTDLQAAKNFPQRFYRVISP